MTRLFSRVTVAAALLLLLVAGPALALPPDVKCEALKAREAGQYARCRLDAGSRALKKGVPADFSKCDLKFTSRWDKIEANGDGQCPTEFDREDVRAAIAYEADRLALWLSGSDPLGASRVPASGQTTAYTADKNDGIPGPVAIPDDGTLQSGATLSYVDNGDGTITDRVTGLMWEKKSEDGSLHDWKNEYKWDGTGSQETIWDWLDDVNAEGGPGFAGYSDWRIPTVKELQTIVDYEVFDPAIDPAFNNGCAAACTVTTCSCTETSVHWTASVNADFPEFPWSVDFFNGVVNAIRNTSAMSVRAVRGGL